MARYPKRNLKPPKERIDSSTGLFMVITALWFDFLQIALGIFALLVTPFMWLTFFVWLKLHKVTIGDSVKRIALMFGGFLVELIPIVNILPAWNLMIFITVLLVQRSDKKKIEEFYKNSKASQEKKRYTIPTTA